MISAAREWACLTEPEREFVERCGIRSAVGVGLRSSAGDTLGVLFTNSGRERFFDETAFDDIVRMGRTIGDSLARKSRQRVFHMPLATLGEDVQSRGLSAVEERLMSALLRDRDLEDLCRALEDASGCRLRVVDESRGVVYSSADRGKGRDEPPSRWRSRLGTGTPGPWRSARSCAATASRGGG